MSHEQIPSELIDVLGALSRSIEKLSDHLVATAGPLSSKLSAIAAAQSAQSEQLAALTTQGQTIMATLDDDVAAISAQTTVIASLGAFIQSLKDQITGGGVTGLTPAQQAQIDDIFANVTANNAAIAAALTTNTPVAQPVAGASASAAFSKPRA